MNNVAIGFQTMNANTIGYYNTANGFKALNSNFNGYYNTANGFSALRFNTTGSGNVADGSGALYTITTGSNNTGIGANADCSFNNATNCTAIGYNARNTDASNSIVLGNSSIAFLRCQVQTITSLSDERDKKDVEDIPVGLEFIDKLHPVKFVWNMRDGGKVGQEEFGFIAQELQAVQEQTNVTVPNLVDRSNLERLCASYGALIPVMVKAIQELSAKVEELKNNK